MMFEMRERAVDMIGQERATRTTLLPFRTEHEVIDNQLAASVEEIRKTLFSFGAIEDVLLRDFDPWELSALCTERVSPTCKFFFLLKQLFPSSKPRRFRDNCRAFKAGLRGFSFCLFGFHTSPLSWFLLLF